MDEKLLGKCGFSYGRRKRCDPCGHTVFLPQFKTKSLLVAIKPFLCRVFLLNHFQEFVLGEDGDSQLSCLALLGTGVFAHHHEAGLF